MDTLFLIVSFPVSSSRETFVKKYSWSWGGAIIESVLNETGQAESEVVVKKNVTNEEGGGPHQTRPNRDR